MVCTKRGEGWQCGCCLLQGCLSASTSCSCRCRCLCLNGLINAQVESKRWLHFHAHTQTSASSLAPPLCCISHLSTLISQFSFGVSEICDFEFWLEIKLSLAISIKSEAAAAEAGALRKQAYVCISDESAAPAPGQSSVPLPSSGSSDPPPSTNRAADGALRASFHLVCAH